MSTKALVTISLDRLVQLRAEARGFSFLLRQPVHSLLRYSYVRSSSYSLVLAHGKRLQR